MNITKQRFFHFYTCIRIMAAVGFLFYGYQLFMVYHDVKQETDDQAYLQKIAGRNHADDENPQIDWHALQNQNPDIIGWIRIPDTDIDYPIVQGDDNRFYLTHNFLKEEHYTGAIFLDASAKDDFSLHNSFLYGHNVQQGSMFAQLEKFKDEAFFNDHPFLYVYTPDTAYLGEIAAMYSTTAVSEVYQMPTTDTIQFQNYIQMLYKNDPRSRLLDLNIFDHLITLSTCSYESGSDGDARYVLHAILKHMDGNS